MKLRVGPSETAMTDVLREVYFVITSLIFFLVWIDSGNMIQIYMPNFVNLLDIPSHLLLYENSSCGRLHIESRHIISLPNFYLQILKEIHFPRIYILFCFQLCVYFLFDHSSCCATVVVVG